MSHNVAIDKSFSLAVRIVRLCRLLRKRDVERELISQLIRSGTSIAANLAEAQYGNSGEDFLYRVRIALRECSETQLWLRLLHETGDLKLNEFKSIENDCIEVLKILTAISVTMRQSREN